MVRQTRRSLIEVEFTEDECAALENGESVEFTVGGEDISVSFGEEEEPRVRDTHIHEDTVKYDQKPQQWSDGKVVVTEVTDTPAHEVDAIRRDPKNAEYPDNDPVVKARYIEEGGERSREYSFPASRLGRTSANQEKKEDPENLGDLFK